MTAPDRDSAMAARRTGWPAIGVAGLAAAGPILVALVRALRRGWYPVADNAYFSIRARDVLTEHHPLLGTWTSASLSVGHDMNNPGPLLWDLLALPAKVAPVAGIAVATAVLNVLCIVVMGLVAHRRGGTPRTVGVLAAAAALGWTMGSELLLDPWQPHALMFPFLLYLVVVWSLVEGDVTVLPVAVGVASVLVQTHLTYAVLVPMLGLLGVASIAVQAWRTRRAESDGWGKQRRTLARTAAVTIVVAAVCWSQPLVEQVTAPEGNLTRLVENGGGGGDPRIGIATATRLLADSAVVPPAWGRPSFGRPFVQERNSTDGGVHLLHLPTGPTSVVALVLLGVALAGGAWRARRHRDAGAVAGVVVAATAMVLAVLTAAAVPVGSTGLGAHQVRWLWPIGIVALLVVVLALGGTSRCVVRGLVGAAIVLGAATLPTYRQPVGPSANTEAMAVMLAMAGALDGVVVDGPVLFAAADLRRMSLYEPYSTPMMLEMERRGIGFVVDDPSQARQVGETRLHPEEATVRMVLLEGDRALDAPAGGRRIGYVAGLDDDEHAELRRRVEQLAAELPGKRLRLTERGRQLAARGVLPGLEPDGSVDVDVALNFRTLLVALEDDVLAPGTPDLDQMRRYAILQYRWDRGALAAYLVPIDEPASVIDE